jgi:hypothetical protein
MRTSYGLFCAALLLFAGIQQAKAGSVSVCTGIAGNLASNCGFETGDFTSWTLSGNDVPGELDNLYGVEGVDPDGIAPNSGNYQAFFGDLVDNATTVSQTIATVLPGEYTVSLYLAQDTAATGTCNAVPCANEFGVTLDGVTVFDFSDVPVEGYTEYVKTVDVSNPSSVLNITLGNDLGYFLLDDVSVVATATPEPSAWKLAFLACILASLYYTFNRAKDRRFASSR